MKTGQIIEKPEAFNSSRWRQAGYDDGRRFAWQEADYEELAAIARAGAIPVNWDLFRAQIVQKFSADLLFDFQAYCAGFAQACVQFYQRL